MIDNTKPKKEYDEQQLTTIQISTKTRDALKKLGRMDDDWETLMQRISQEYVLFDDEIDKQLEDISKKYGMSRKMIITIGIAILIFLANSGILQQITKTKKPNVAGLIAEFIKFKLK
jgi:hypothetical protein